MAGRDGVEASYVVAGYMADDAYAVKLVHQDEVERAEKAFSKVVAKYVHTVFPAMHGEDSAGARHTIEYVACSQDIDDAIHATDPSALSRLCSIQAVSVHVARVKHVAPKRPSPAAPAAKQEQGTTAAFHSFILEQAPAAKTEPTAKKHKAAPAKKGQGSLLTFFNKK